MEKQRYRIEIFFFYVESMLVQEQSVQIEEAPF